MPELRNTRTCTWAVATMAIFLGCGGDHKPSDGPPDGPRTDGPVSPPEPIDVHGTFVRHCVTDHGVDDLPVDLSMTSFTSLTPTASGFERRTAMGAAGGTFMVPVGVACLRGSSRWASETRSSSSATRPCQI